jgi:hypothetical protein
MKLINIVDSESAYVYSTSYRFCFPYYAFSPATTVGPTDGDMGKAISFMWQRRDRGSLAVLHTSLCEAAEEWSLFRLHRLSVLAWALGGGGVRSVEALGILAKGAKQAGDTFPFDDRTLNAVRSFAPTVRPDSYLLQQGKDAWSKWTSDGYLALAESLGWRSVSDDYWANKKWQAEVDRRIALGLCHRCGRPKEKGDYCQNCFDDIMLRHKHRLDRRLAGFDLRADT